MFFAQPQNRDVKEVKSWVKAAMNATVIVQAAAINGGVTPERLQVILDGVLNGAVNEILKIQHKRTDPSVN